MIKTFIINGAGGSGKDTFIAFVENYINSLNLNPPWYVRNNSAIDEIKEIAIKYFGWNKIKTNINRRLLSDLKEMQITSCDGPYKYILNLYKTYKFYENNNCLFFHIREIPEIKKIKDEIKAKTILVYRNDVKYGNRSDDDILKYHYDYIINNHGDLKDLKQLAINFTNENIINKKP